MCQPVAFQLNGAEGGTRTPTVLRPSAPQAGASANSATSALGGLEIQSIRPRRREVLSAYFFAGAGEEGAGENGAGANGVGDAGVVLAGEVWAGAVLPGVSSTDRPERFVAHTESVIEVAAKIAASTQVIFARVDTAPRGPKAAWLTPPKAAVISTFSPPCIITDMMSRMQTTI